MYKEMVEYLEGLANGEMPERQHLALCENFRFEFGKNLHDYVYFFNYEDFSGERGFPVPGGINAFFEEEIWGKGWYAEERRKFCQWCADEIYRLYVEL